MTQEIVEEVVEESQAMEVEVQQIEEPLVIPVCISSTASSPNKKFENRFDNIINEVLQDSQTEDLIEKETTEESIQQEEVEVKHQVDKIEEKIVEVSEIQISRVKTTETLTSEVIPEIKPIKSASYNFDQELDRFMVNMKSQEPQHVEQNAQILLEILKAYSISFNVPVQDIVESLSGLEKQYVSLNVIKRVMVLDFC